MSWKPWCAAAVVGLAACVQTPLEPAGGHRWISVDADGAYAIAAAGVPRGALLDELEQIAKIEVRPAPPRDEPVTIQAANLTLEDAIARVMPEGARYAVRLGEREVAVRGPREPRKIGPDWKPVDGAVAKDDKDGAPMLRTGRLKLDADKDEAERPVIVAGGKPQAAELMRVAQAKGPKESSAQPAERATVRLTLEIVDGQAPRLIAAQQLEGRAPMERIVTGSYVFVVVGADGRLAQYGSFQDPLVEHSYLPEGRHSEGRAKTGVVGISILKEHLRDARLLIVDTRGTTMPNVLDDETVRGLLARNKPVLELEAERITRALQPETKK